MFSEIVNALTDSQRSQLAERGIERELLYAWRKGKRLPTEIQVADVAQVTGTEWAELQKEITVLRAPENRREQIAKAINWRKRLLPNYIKRAAQLLTMSATRLSARRA